MYIDFHCHLADEQYREQEIQEIIDTCQKENIIICSMSTDLNDFKKNLEYTKYNNVLIGFGIHPYEAHKINKNYEKIEETLKKYKDKISFLGEVGLDFYKMEETKKEQIEIFEYFVNLSCEYDLPLSIHTRGAEREVSEILTKYQKQKKIKAIFHCFTSTDKIIVNTILENDWYFEFGGVITFKKSNELRNILKYIYEAKGKILCETDSPYITPEPYRGQKNYPYYVKIVYDFIANFLNDRSFIKQLPIEIYERY